MKKKYKTNRIAEFLHAFWRKYGIITKRNYRKVIDYYNAETNVARHEANLLRGKIVELHKDIDRLTLFAPCSFASDCNIDMDIKEPYYTVHLDIPSLHIRCPVNIDGLKYEQAHDWADTMRQHTLRKYNEKLNEELKKELNMVVNSLK